MDSSSLFTDITARSGIHYLHQERDYIDFNVQKLLPHKLSEYGPAIAVGDIDGNGTDDFITGGAAFHPAQIFLQQTNGKFIQRPLVHSGDSAWKKVDDEALLLFDADGDGDQDIYIVSGSYEAPRNSPAYQDFAVATMQNVLSSQDREGALILEANEFRSCYLRNEGNGKFSMHPLPQEAQYSIINGMVVDDFDEDGNLDVLLTGNDYGTEPLVGRYDALNGLLLKGDGKGKFLPLSILQSGIYIPGNGKAVAELRAVKGQTLIAASQNRGYLKLFALRKSQPLIPVTGQVTDFMFSLRSGQKRKQELYYGSSFLSQSGRYLKKTPQVTATQKRDKSGNWVNFIK